MQSRLCLLLAMAGLSVTASSSTPCRQISDIYNQTSKATGSSNPALPGQLAHECLLTMPFNAERGAKFIQELRKLMQWQTTLEVLKNPPSGYPAPPTDLLGGLDDLEKKATRAEYSSQFEFDWAVNKLLQTAHDGHLSITLCSQGIFDFAVDLPLVSVSSDGVKLPRIYTVGDAALLASDPGLVSPLASVNDQDAVLFFNDFAMSTDYQDPDARYNTLFHAWRYPTQLISLNHAGSWESNKGVWPGSPQFKVEFVNGTVMHVQTTATAGTTYLPSYQDGKDIFQTACVPQPVQTASPSLFSVSSPPGASHLNVLPFTSQTSTKTMSASSKNTSTSPTPSASPISSGYPAPMIQTGDSGSISGYYLDHLGLKDVAVLFVSTFAPQAEDFSEKATEFVYMAKRAGKKKLIIDLSNNLGGSPYLGVDLFKLFFPNLHAYTATRFRAHEASDLVGKALSKVRTTQSTVIARSYWFDLSTMVTPDQQSDFTSWPDAFGPHEELGTQVSSLLALGNFTLMSAEGSSIRGYGPAKQKETVPPFAAKDILMVTNGVCMSTCTTFAELMKNIGGVKSLVFGGRPHNGPMQAIGGTKGEEDISSGMLPLLYQEALEVATNATQEGNPALTDAQLKRLKEITPATNEQGPLTGLETTSVNFLNGYRPGQEHMPLQFIYEPADYRLFYTWENLAHPATAWAAAARTFWGNGLSVKGTSSHAAQHHHRAHLHA